MYPGLFYPYNYDRDWLGPPEDISEEVVEDEDFKYDKRKDDTACGFI